MSREIQKLQQKLQMLQTKFAEVESAYNRLEYRFQQIDALYSIASGFSAIVNLEELLEVARKNFRKLLKIDRFRFILDSRAIHESTTRVASDLLSFVDPPKPQSDLLAQVLKERKLSYIQDLSRLKGKTIPQALNFGAGSLLTIPLLTDEHTVLGVMAFSRKQPNAFDDAEIDLLEQVTKEVAKAWHHLQLFEHTRELSIKDELTGIFNRRYFNQRFEREVLRSQRYQRALAVVMADIDHFKRYNDLNGHILGDDVLKHVAETLESNLRKADIVCRFGGEEFIVLLPEISKAQARKAANKLRSQIEREGFEREETQPENKITISLGVAVFPEDATRAEELLKAADQALYLAKSMGRNCVAWHGMKPTLRNGSQESRQKKLV